MKALKSKLATELLADSAARGQLREFLVNKRSTLHDRQGPDGAFEIRRGTSAGTVFATIVPKAAKAV